MIGLTGKVEVTDQLLASVPDTASVANQVVRKMIADMAKALTDHPTLIVQDMPLFRVERDEQMKTTSYEWGILTNEGA